MTKTEPTVITVWKSGLSVPDITGRLYSAGRVAYRGEVITLSPEQVEETVDLNGDSWLDLTEDQQLDRYGEVRFKHGDHSAEVGFVGDDDSTVRWRRREYAVLAAGKLTDPLERREAFADIAKTYGPTPSTQTSTPYPGR